MSFEYFDPCWIVFEDDGYNDLCPHRPIKVFRDKAKACEYVSQKKRETTLDGINYSIEESELELGDK